MSIYAIVTNVILAAVSSVSKPSLNKIRRFPYPWGFADPKKLSQQHSETIEKAKTTEKQKHSKTVEKAKTKRKTLRFHRDQGSGLWTRLSTSLSTLLLRNVLFFHVLCSKTKQKAQKHKKFRNKMKREAGSLVQGPEP